ncbi:MAG: flavin reductase family protein [Phycisphaerales bacterium]|nr:flavin reductase family protein [Phycisphaerales bacterium]
MSETQKAAPGGVLSGERSGIGAAIGRIPSGCAILTVEHGGRSTGVLVSWVQQASFEPPSVTVCIRKGRPAAELIDGSQRFLLNLIGDDPTEMFRHFGRGFSLENDAFRGIETEPTEFGVLLRTCIAYLGCRVTQKVAVGDHDLYVAEVVAAASVNGAKPYTHLRSTGLSY